MFKWIAKLLEDAPVTQTVNDREDVLNVLRAIVKAGLGVDPKYFRQAKIEYYHRIYYSYSKNDATFNFGPGNSDKARRFAFHAKSVFGEENVRTSVYKVTISNDNVKTKMFYKFLRVKKDFFDTGVLETLPDDLFIRHHPMLITILNTLNEINQYSIADIDLYRECIELFDEFLNDVDHEKQKQKEAAERDKAAIAKSLKERVAFEREVIEYRKKRMSEIPEYN